ncbi:MAG: SRPBCC domain-containing protein [Thermoplasmatota archaeon]
MPQTLQLHRHIQAPPERVFAAFLDPDAMVKWNPPHGFVGKMYEHKAEVGGVYRMSFRNLGTGTEHSFGGKYVEITPHSRIRWTDAFDESAGEAMQGEMMVTVDLEPTAIGTQVTITQAGLPDAMPKEFATAGWQESLQLLEMLVVPDIPDGDVPVDGDD